MSGLASREGGKANVPWGVGWMDEWMAMGRTSGAARKGSVRRVIGCLEVSGGKSKHGLEVGSEDAADVDGGAGVEDDGFGEVDAGGEGGPVAVGVEDAVAAVGDAGDAEGDADALFPAVAEEEVEGGVVEAAEDEAAFLLALLELAGEFDLFAGGGERGGFEWVMGRSQ